MKEHRRPGRGMPFRNTGGSGSSGALKATLRALLVLMVIASGIGASIIYSVVSRGLSTHDAPSRAEEMLARTMRRWATPQAARTRANPVPPTDEVLGQALEHFADHCAMCHANNGNGDTAIGRSLYPKAPDMRGANTQSLTDGELFSIIEHGIRLTGMPGWRTGTPEGERASWGLVHFIRRLPKLTPEEIERMESFNPKTPAQFKEEEEARRFLQGEPSGPPSGATKKGHQD